MKHFTSKGMGHHLGYERVFQGKKVAIFVEMIHYYKESIGVV